MKLNILTLTMTLILTTGCAQVAYQVQGDKPIEEPETRTLGEVIDDNGLETQVKVALLQADEAFQDSRVRVISYNAKVLLVGQVPSQELFDKANAAVNKMPRVRTLHNELEVGEKIGVNIRTSDSWLGTKVKSRMFTTDDFPSRKINIITENGVVYLMGIVDSQVAIQAATIASEINGVQKVVTLFEQPKS